MAVPSLIEKYKVDVGLVGQTINNSNVTGPYYPTKGIRKAAVIVIDGAQAVNKTTKVEWLQATDLAGTGAKVVKQANATAGTESSATSVASATSLTGATEAVLTLNGMLNADTITINGVVFTAHTDTTTANLRQFKIDGDNDADAVALAGLINNATYGVPGVTAAAGTASVTLTSTTPGATVITCTTSNATRCAPSYTKAVLYSEVDVSDLDIAGGFVYVAPKVTKTGNGTVAAVVIREVGDYRPTAQKVAAGTSI
jgi:hypothetical protein